MQTTLSPPLQLRIDDDGTAAISGLAVPYDVDARIGEVTERFARGSVNVAELAGAPILWNHDPADVIGHIVTASEGDDGAHVDAVIQPTARGRDAITLLRAGSVRGLSVGFEPIEQTWDGSAVTRSAVRVREVSIATMPAYEDAKVLAVRKEQPVPDTTTPEVAETREVAVDLSPITDRMDALEARMHTTAEPARTLAVREAFALALTDYAHTRQTRAIADVVSAGNAGVLPPQWLASVAGYYDNLRWLLPRCGQLGFPASGYTLTVPSIGQHTLVSARGVEKTEVPSRAFQVTSDTFTAKWYAGAVDIAVELLEQSDPAILGLIVDDLRAQYAAATEDSVVTDAEAAATATGAALSLSTYGAFVGDVIAQSEAIRVATGQPGDRLALQTASWQAVLGLVDADDRRIFATGGATNSDGSANLLAQSINVGGVEVFHSPYSAVDLQFNTMALQVAEKPPMQLSADNVALMGRDVGIIGAVITVPVYPAGVRKYSA